MSDKINKLIEQGVKIRDKEKVDIRGELVCGKNVVIDINVIFEGEVTLEDNVVINANCIISNSVIKNSTIVKPFSLIEGAEIGEQGFVGPFGRVREGSFVGNKVQLGNFVEVKNTHIGDGCRINHMTFIGDSEIGRNVTIGAGTITCNYDGKVSHKTHIKENAFIGSGTNLIAPLKVGANATIASGSTITEDAPENKLTIARNRQVTKDEWSGPGRKK